MEYYISIVMVVSFAGILLPLGLNLVLLSTLFLSVKKKEGVGTAAPPAVSIITVVHNGEDLITKKIQNALSLNYPSGQYEIIIYSDGSTDNTADCVKPFLGGRVLFFSSEDHRGKINGMNEAAVHCSGDIIVFTNADAILKKDAVIKLAGHFSDPEIGGVCGQRIITEEKPGLKKAQSSFISFDSLIKKLESRSGSISSNDGKIYAVRKNLYSPVPEGVTDDLYVCLSVISKGYRFIFEPDARAYIHLPSRTASHEVLRRRRITAASLMGIYLMKEVLNPFKYGMFSLNLMVNKILRRLLPVFLILLFLSSLLIAFRSPLAGIVLAAQIVFYLSAVFYHVFLRHSANIVFLTKICSVIYYFCVGNYGLLMGLMDFLGGRQQTKWKPVKTGQ
ncbi:MAG: glycosyltransferase [Nitrospirae bacterium]|nr:glycosyltransferase [Nitrospirota bacterium]